MLIQDVLPPEQVVLLRLKVRTFRPHASTKTKAAPSHHIKVH